MSGTSAVAIDNKIEQAMVRNCRNRAVTLLDDNELHCLILFFFLGFG